LVWGVGASGNEDFPFVVAPACWGSWLSSETPSSRNRTVPSWDCPGVFVGSWARTHAVPKVPASATAMQNDRIDFKSSLTSALSLSARSALLLKHFLPSQSLA